MWIEVMANERMIISRLLDSYHVVHRQKLVLCDMLRKVWPDFESEYVRALETDFERQQASADLALLREDVQVLLDFSEELDEAPLRFPESDRKPS
jgi:hypothetical protein